MEFLCVCHKSDGRHSRQAGIHQMRFIRTGIRKERVVPTVEVICGVASVAILGTLISMLIRRGR